MECPFFPPVCVCALYVYRPHPTQINKDNSNKLEKKENRIKVGRIMKKRCSFCRITREIGIVTDIFQILFESF